MSANRKLQSEVDKVMKKIEEGVEIFDEIWDKVYAAPQQSLKEKYESDLKKEIKKLQRLRDQIKTWHSSNDIKDKTSLVDAKKLIESKMEQFKICEKETKTKAFSKEGLAREEKLDPHEIEKEISRAWVQAIVERIENFVESWEADIEKISSAKGKNKNKDQLLRLDSKVSTNRWHIKTLEQINRLIDNDSLEVEKLNGIKEDIDYFVECMENDDGDGIDEDYNIYEDLQLDSLAGNTARAGSISSSSDKDLEQVDTPADTSVSSNMATITASGTATVGGVEIGKKAVVPVNSSPSILSPTKTLKTPKTAKPSVKAAPVPTVTPTTTPAVTTPVNEGPTTAWATAASKPNQNTTTPPPPTPSIAPKPVPEPSTNNSSTSSSAGVSKGGSSKTAPTPTPAPLPPSPSKVMAPEKREIIATPPPPALFDDSSGVLSSAEVLSRTNTPSSIHSIVGGVPRSVSDSSRDQQSQSPPFMQQFSSQQTTSLNQQQHPQQLQQQQQQHQQLSNDPPSVLAPSSDQSKAQHMPQFGNSQELQSISNLLKMSMMHTPPANDVPTDNRQKGFTPKNPYTSHPSFPTQQPAVFENPAIFERLPIDSLFLAFYYQQGSYQQYLAARQLKKNSWRFHKKYMTWFQRHEEPRVTTDEYEQGTYVYFDYESGWCQRIKSEFKFEYCYLEDELTQPQNP